MQVRLQRLVGPGGASGQLVAHGFRYVAHRNLNSHGPHYETPAADAAIVAADAARPHPLPTTACRFGRPAPRRSRRSDRTRARTASITAVTSFPYSIANAARGQAKSRQRLSDSPRSTGVRGIAIRSSARSLRRVRDRRLPSAFSTSISFTRARARTASSRSENRAAVLFATACRIVCTVTGSSTTRACSSAGMSLRSCSLNCLASRSSKRNSRNVSSDRNASHPSIPKPPNRSVRTCRTCPSGAGS